MLEPVNSRFISSQQQPVENRCQDSHWVAPATNRGKRRGDFILSRIRPQRGFLEIYLTEGELQPVPWWLAYSGIPPFWERNPDHNSLATD